MSKRNCKIQSNGGLSTSSYTTLELYHKSINNIKQFMITKDYNVLDFIQLVKISLRVDEDFKVAGVRNTTTDVIYPISFILQNSVDFHGQNFELIGVSKEHSNLSKYNQYFTKEKAEYAFLCLDSNSDGRLDRHEMVRFLTIAILCLQQLLHDAEMQLDNNRNTYNINDNPEILAKSITESFFLFIGLHEELFASTADFTAWYLAVEKSDYHYLMVYAIEAYRRKLGKDKNLPLPVASSLDLTKSSKLISPSLQESILELRNFLGLEYVSIQSLAIAYRSEVSDISTKFLDPFISREVFIKRMSSLIAVTNGGSASHISEYKQSLNLLFDSLQPLSSSDAIPLSSLLSTMCLLYCNIDSLSHNYFEYEKYLRELFLLIHDIKDKDSKLFISDRMIRDYIYRSVLLLLFLSPRFREKIDIDSASYVSLLVFGIISQKFRDNTLEIHNSLSNSSDMTIGCLSLTNFIQIAKDIIKVFISIETGDYTIPSYFLDSFNATIDIHSTEKIESISTIINYEQIRFHLIDIRNIFGLTNQESNSMVAFAIFKNEVVDSQGNISGASYYNCIHKLLRRQYMKLSNVDRMILDYVVHRLFGFFTTTLDDNETETHSLCDLMDVTISIVTWCGTSHDEKSKCLVEIFHYFGDDADAYNSDDATESNIDLAYLAMCTEPIIVAIATLLPNISLEDRFLLEEISDELSQFSGSSIFNSDRISITQFESWFNTLLQVFEEQSGILILEQVIQEQKMCIANEKLEYDENYMSSLEQLILTTYRNNNPNIRFLETEGLLSLDINEELQDLEAGEIIPMTSRAILEELRNASKRLGLNVFSSDDLMDTFGEYTNIQGMLKLSTYQKVMSKIFLLSNITGEKLYESHALAKEIFLAFLSVDHSSDIESELVVPYQMITCALTILSSSPTEEKLGVCFSLLSSDGFISHNHLELLIFSYLKLISICSKVAQEKINSLQDIDLSTISKAVASECISILGCQDQDISLEMLCEVANDCIVMAENITI